MSVHPIEAESYRILAERVDLSGFAPGPASVVARVVHATADEGFARTMVVDGQAVAAGTAALAAGAPVVCDVEMVRAGLGRLDARCYLGEVADGRPTRSAAAIRLAAGRHPDGAVFVVGCAPTALVELVGLIDGGALRPALVVGLPVGYVGAAEAKAALAALAGRRGTPVVTNRGERGGSAAAVAAVVALERLAAAGR